MIRYLDELPAAASVVVVGGGVVGGATAFYLSGAGFDVVLVEMRPELCSFTSAAATGGYRLQLENAEEIAAVRRSLELFENFADATGQSDYGSGLRPAGYLWLTTTEEGAVRQRSAVARMADLGIDDVDVLDGDETRERFPFVAPEVVQARYRPGDGFVDPVGLTMGLIAGSGARVCVGTRVVGFDVRDGALRTVVSDKGPIETRAAVIAAGPLSPLLAARAGVNLPIETVLRQKLVMPDLPVVPPEAPMTIDEDTGAHWRPALRGAFALSNDPDAVPSDPVEEIAADPGYFQTVLDPGSPLSVARTVPFWREVWERGPHNWQVEAGQYDMTPDHRPLIGETEIEGLFVNTGYSGHGVMAGPGCSALLADVMSGRAGDNPFRPGRTFRQATSRAL